MKHPTYASLFSGAGGLDIGLERAGFHAISLNEIEPSFCETLSVNQGTLQDDGKRYFNGSKIINADIREVSAGDLAHGNQVDLVVGGPPCQSFSSAGKQLSVLDPRGGLLDEFFRLIEAINPKMFLFENVRGLVTARDAKGEPGGVIKRLLERFWEAGYGCRCALLNAADYGVCQRRVRCFMIGTKKGRAPSFPQPTHHKTGNLFCEKWTSLKNFLEVNADHNPENHTFPTENLASHLAGLPNGTGLKSQGKSERTRPGGHWGYRQGTFIADLELPARTVTGSSSQDWVRWNGLLRRLTFHEVKLLQGFPASWKMAGTKTQRYKQVGNAVPTIFGELIGHVLREYIGKFRVCPT